MDSRTLRERAARYRQLARAINDDRVIAELEAEARALEARADQIGNGAAAANSMQARR